jgi:hypothetical protein
MLLQSFAEINDPVRAFASEMRDWDIDGISTDIAFKSFQDWYIDAFGEGRCSMGKRRFTEQMRSVCASIGWEDWTARRWTSTCDCAVRIADRSDSVSAACGQRNIAPRDAKFLVCEPGHVVRGYRRAARREQPSTVARIFPLV